MTKNRSFRVGTFVLLWLALSALTIRSAVAHPLESGQARQQSAAQTPNPTQPPVILDGPTPEARLLPAVGSNAGLVLGASLLVMIIIGGVVLSSRRKRNIDRG